MIFYSVCIIPRHSCASRKVDSHSKCNSLLNTSGMGTKSKTFPRRWIDNVLKLLNFFLVYFFRLGLSWHEPPDASVDVLDPALLPRLVRMTEIGLYPQCIPKLVMSGKLSAIIKGDGLSHRLWHRGQLLRQDALNAIRLLVGVPMQEVIRDVRSCMTSRYACYQKPSSGLLPNDRFVPDSERIPVSGQYPLGAGSERPDWRPR